MKAKIELINFRRINKTTNYAEQMEIEQTFKYTTTINENNIISFHNIEPFNNSNLNNEYFIVKSIKNTCIELLVKNCENTSFVLNKVFKQTNENETIILPLNNVLYINDSFNDIYITTTIRVVEILNDNF